MHNIRVVFDNEQVIGKRYTVKVDNNTVPMSIITSHAYIVIDELSVLQNSQEVLSQRHGYLKH